VPPPLSPNDRLGSGPSFLLSLREMFSASTSVPTLSFAGTTKIRGIGGGTGPSLVPSLTQRVPLKNLHYGSASPTKDPAFPLLRTRRPSYSSICDHPCQRQILRPKASHQQSERCHNHLLGNPPPTPSSANSIFPQSHVTPSLSSPRDRNRTLQTGATSRFIRTTRYDRHDSAFSPFLASV